MSARNIVSSETKRKSSSANRMRPGPVGQTQILRPTNSKTDVTKTNKPRKGNMKAKPGRVSRQTSMSATIEEEPTRRNKRLPMSEIVKRRGKVTDIKNSVNEEQQEISAGPIRGAELVDADRNALVVTDLEESSCNNGNPNQHDKNVQDIDSSSDSDGLYDTDLEEEFPGKTFELDRFGKSAYVYICGQKGIIPVSYLLSRFTEEEILMPHHGLGPEGGDALAKALVVNTTVETLDLADNGLQSKGAASLSYMLYENAYITDLNLSENDLGVSAGVALAQALIMNNTVKRLILQGNRLNDKVAMALAETLKENSALAELDRSYNELGETGGLYLGAGLSLNYGLRSLNLKWNEIVGKGAVSIAHALSTNVTLTSLDLSWNSFGHTGTIALAKHLNKNNALKHLDLSNNHIREDALKKLTRAIAKHQYLVEIKIGQNPIGPGGVGLVLDAVIRNPMIKHVGLEDISVPLTLLPQIQQLEEERDINILADKQTRLSSSEHEKPGMDILMEFLEENAIRLKDMFFQLDKDRSGDITRKEFKFGLKEMGILMDSRQLDILIREIDANNNDKIDYSEIVGGRKNARLKKKRQTEVETMWKKKDEESIQAPEMDQIKKTLSLKSL